jgi:hypothetical protein
MKKQITFIVAAALVVLYISAGGEQLVEVFHVKDNTVKKEPLVDNYHLKEC